MAKKTSLEDAFFENLTLGLLKTLSNVARICDVKCDKRHPCEKAQVSNWEQRHCVYLPEDMKKFFLSVDGFALHWSYQYAPSDIRRVGHIHCPHLLQITLLRENVEPIINNSSTHYNCSLISGIMEHFSGGVATIPSTPMTVGHAPPALPAKDLWGNPTPVLTAKSKIFELNNVNDVVKVCLVYESTGSSNPKIYLLELDTFKWQFLADTFSEYLRMAIAHLGLPYWELCFASIGLPSWTEENVSRRDRIIQPVPEYPQNVIDPTVFRIKSKGMTKTNPTTSKPK